MRKRDPNVTIRDVAKTADVSVGTASRVINNKQTVRPELRTRVQKAIETLGYRPNAVAQSMRRRSTQMVGCIIREINIPSLAAFVRAAHDVLDDAGLSLLLSNSEGLREREMELLDRLNSQQSDGIMFGPYTPIDEDFDAFLRSLDAPIVLVDRNEPKWADAVMANHDGGTFEATTRLLELGHRRIALLTGNRLIYPAGARVRGYCRAFAAAGVPLDESLIRTTSFASAEGFRHTSALLAGRAVPTAIIAGGIDMLPGVLRAVRVRGLTIPRDISIVASGDGEVAQLYTPSISVVHWDQAEIGRTAAHLLLKRMRGDDDPPPEHVLLPTEFIQRASIAPPPKGTALSDGAF